MGVGSSSPLQEFDQRQSTDIQEPASPEQPIIDDFEEAPNAIITQETPCPPLLHSENTLTNSQQLAPTSADQFVSQENASSTPTMPVKLLDSDSDDDHGDDGDCDDENPSHLAMMQPLVLPSLKTNYPNSTMIHLLPSDILRSRKGSKADSDSHIVMINHTNTGRRSPENTFNKNVLPIYMGDYLLPRESRTQLYWRSLVRFYRDLVKNTIVCMNILAKILFWISLLCLIVGVVWYSMELHQHGTDPHLIAWFSAGAFVILGFPISMYGIIMQLSNYYQPNVQAYVVRILWMVPFYSIESWLSLRFHRYAIYIQTLRDFYESYVLYCFFQFLIEVLGGEEALINMLKDKSPTRGVHYPPLNWFMKPWIMGQPVSKTAYASGGILHSPETTSTQHIHKPTRVQWTSPFFVQCKFGVLQYVLLKFISALFVVILEKIQWYKEGDFTPKGGYLYICILTNTSQCWALYCLVFFYYATKNELSPIRPVGKFLSVKALVFFTWWQSVGISILFYFGSIKPYKNGEWTAEAVAKGIQDYMICVELFFFAIAHIFVFPHTDYLQPLGMDGKRLSGIYMEHRKRLGRKRPYLQSQLHPYGRVDDKSVQSKSSSMEGDLTDMSVLCDDKGTETMNRLSQVNETWGEVEGSSDEVSRPSSVEISPKRTGFVRAFLDSAVPRDVMDNTVGLARGDYMVEKKTLLSHAAASDEYKLFATKLRRTHLRSR